MKQFGKIKYWLHEKLTLYPILIGILFLINELRNNAIFYTLNENISLVLIILGFTFGADFLSRKIIKNKIKAALIASLFIVINLFYQDIYLFISSQFWFINVVNTVTSNHPEVIVLLVLIFAWITFTFFVLRTKRIFTSLNLYLNVLIVAFILIEFVKSVIVPIPQINLVDTDPFPVNINLTIEQKPDIYYIILDAYTSSESLKKYWKYDNSAFEDSLIQSGFQIAHKSRSDYAATLYCLASYLNSSVLIMDSTKLHNERNLLKLIKNNRLSVWLDANSYHCYNFSLFDLFAKNKYYEYFFYHHFLGRTLWYINYIKLYHFFKPLSNISPTNLKIFTELNSLAKSKSNIPFFVYAHIMMPHIPYTFNETGESYKASDSLTDKQKYLGQLIYTNHLILKTIKLILKSTQKNPIVIIQGDHGYRNLLDTTIIEQTHEAHTILYAIHSSKDLKIPDNFSPVNTYKEIIREINQKSKIKNQFMLK